MGKLRAIVVFAVCVALSGCVGAKIHAAKEEMEKEKAACQTVRHPSQMSLARCINAAEEKAFRGATSGDGDLVSVRLATRMAIAEKIDKGQMTQAEGDLEFARANSGLISTSDQRQHNAATADAVSSMARPRSTTCTRYGNSVTCF